MPQTISKRFVLHVGGFDPNLPPARFYRRFVREQRRFEVTWSAKTTVTELNIGPDDAVWDITTTGPNWRVQTHCCLLRWDDIIEALARQPVWQRVVLGLYAFADFTLFGALWGYLRMNWRYALFFLYPFLTFGILVLAAWLAGSLVARTSDIIMIGPVAGLLTFGLLMWGPWRRLGLAPLFDDWIFSSRYVHAKTPVLEDRLDRIAKKINAIACDPEIDEVLIVGHSLGAVIAVDLLDRTLNLDPLLDRRTARIALLTVGSSILKIGLHKAASRFRSSVERVATAPRIFWTEYQALTDIMNFYKTNPVSELTRVNNGKPVVRIVRIRSMLSPTSYERIRRNFYRVHSQFVSGNERRVAYDYFMLVCGPLSAEEQVSLPAGATTAIDEHGALIGGSSNNDPREAGRTGQQ